jgi:ABC-type branched-subunit amino acid transport system substrate-binding protein
VITDSADLADLPRRTADLAEAARVTAVLGPESPGVLIGTRSPLSRRGVPALLPSAFAGELDGAATPVARTVPSARAQAEALATWLTDVRGLDQLAVLVADPVEGAAARAAIEAGATAGGLPPVAVIEAAGDAGELTTAVAALRRAAPDADAVLLWGWPDAAARATLAVRELGWDVQIAVGSSAFFGTYRALAGEATEGVVLPFPFREAWFGPDLTSWMIRYQLAFGIGALPGLDTRSSTSPSSPWPATTPSVPWPRPLSAPAAAIRRRSPMPSPGPSTTGCCGPTSSVPPRPGTPTSCTSPASTGWA